MSARASRQWAWHGCIVRMVPSVWTIFYILYSIFYILSRKTSAFYRGRPPPVMRPIPGAAVADLSPDPNLQVPPSPDVDTYLLCAARRGRPQAEMDAACRHAL